MAEKEQVLEQAHVLPEEEGVVSLKNDFYKDSFAKVILIMLSILVAILLLVAVSVYLLLKKPQPISFPVDNEWRVQPSVPLNQPYRSEPDMLQWVSEVVPLSFTFNFTTYNDQLQALSQFYTSDGWKVFLNQLNIYANYNNVQNNRLFVNGSPAGAPFIVNKGLLSGRFAWWVQIPLTINYSGYNPPRSQNIVLQVLVVRVSTLNNLSGVGIDNMILAPPPGSQ